jgi:hypothetical protein
MFVWLQPPEHFVSYPVAFIITGNRAANLDPCLALRPFLCFSLFSVRVQVGFEPRVTLQNKQKKISIKNPVFLWNFHLNVL